MPSDLFANAGISSCSPRACRDLARIRQSLDLLHVDLKVPRHFGDVQQVLGHPAIPWKTAPSTMFSFGAAIFPWTTAVGIRTSSLWAVMFP